MQPIEVGVLGATGMVGQHFVRFLQDHPWFKLTWVGASDRSAGKKYRDATSWRLDGAMPADIADLDVYECKPGNAPPIVFSATDASVATEIERSFAQAGHVVVSNSRNHRMEADVPLLVPEVNYDHLKIIPRQQRERGWKGQIVTNPNCSTIVMTLALAPLKKFGIERIIVTTLQAISGAGYPGVASMDINANVVPSSEAKKRKWNPRRRKFSAILSMASSGRLPRRSARMQSRTGGGWSPMLRVRRAEREAGCRWDPGGLRKLHEPAAAEETSKRAASPRHLHGAGRPAAASPRCGT